MNKRKLIITLAGAGIVAVLLVLSGFLSGGNRQEPPKKEATVVVRTQEVANADLNARIEITGRVIPVDMVSLYAEVSGISTYGSRPFKAGNSFRRGEVLLRIDSRELASSLASAKSQFMSTLAKVLPDLKLDYSDNYPAWKDYLVNMRIDKPMNKLPEVTDEKLKLFLTGRNVYSSYYSIREIETRYSKYVIRAPFSGTLTEANINRGTLVRVGQKLGDFMSDRLYELEGSVLYQELDYLKKGMTIEFSEVNSEKTYRGKLVRINNSVDPTTQLIKVYFQIQDANVKSGLYLSGSVPAYEIKEAVELPIEALVDNSFVFVVEDGRAKKLPVEVVKLDADRFIARGIDTGSKVIIDKKNSAFAGSAVIEL